MIIREGWSGSDEPPAGSPMHKREIVLCILLATFAFLMFLGGLIMLIRDCLT